jgi:hypothetical protein
MAKLTIKDSKPFIEKKVKQKIPPNTIVSWTPQAIIVGVKLYSPEEFNQVKKEFQSISDMSKLTRLGKKLDQVIEDISLTEEQVEEQKLELQNEIEVLRTYLDKQHIDFHKKQVLFLKNIKLSLDGEDINIPDTREVKPIASLWDTPSECLDALLDIYLEDRFYKDALITAIFDAVFGTNLEGERAKN